MAPTLLHIPNTNTTVLTLSVTVYCFVGTGA